MTKSKQKTTHVVPNPDGGWDVKKGGQKEPISHHRKKDSAVNSGRKTSKKEKSELYIHGKDGKIQRKDSHGGDPHPPEG
ncbi:MAG: DUF2188 domain-containing protein [Anaerolineaceae bacterium]|nr:DUF2188 domain-containing protein [Anaerolineaceae bacterium]